MNLSDEQHKQLQQLATIYALGITTGNSDIIYQQHHPTPQTINITKQQTPREQLHTILQEEHLEILNNWHHDQLNQILNPPPTYQITITDPGCGWINANGPHKHWRTHHQQTKKWKWKTLDTIRKNPKPPQPINTPHHATYTTHRTTQHKADADNLAPTLKPVIDALIQEKILTDDNDTILTKRTYQRGPNTKQPTITVTLTPTT